LKKAIEAADSIKPNEIKELGGTKKPTPITMYMMDTIHILFRKPLEPVKEHEF